MKESKLKSTILTAFLVFMLLSILIKNDGISLLEIILVVLACIVAIIEIFMESKILRAFVVFLTISLIIAIDGISLLTIILVILSFMIDPLNIFIEKKYDNPNGMDIQLGEIYENTTEMANALLEKLKSEGKKCQMLESTHGRLTLFTVEDKQYIMMYKMDTISDIPTQLIQLKVCKQIINTEDY